MSSQTDLDEDGAGTSGPVTDLVAGLFLAALAIFALVWLIPTHTQLAMSEYDVSPGFFPRLAAWAVLTLSVGLVATRIPKLRQSGQFTPGMVVLIDLVAWSGTGLFAIWGLVALGFLFTAPILIAAGMLVSGNRTYRLIGLVAILFPLLVDQAAWYIFTVDLP